MLSSKQQELLSELQKRIAKCESEKNNLILYLQELKDKWLEREINYSDYEKIIAEKKNGKNIQEWFDYYDSYISECEKRIIKEKNK